MYFLRHSLHFITCLAFTSMVLLSANEEFCQSFVDNNNDIDYCIDWSFDNNMNVNNYLFIGHKSWQIITDFKNKSLEFVSNISYTNDWLGKEYRMALITDPSLQHPDRVGLVFVSKH